MQFGWIDIQAGKRQGRNPGSAKSGGDGVASFCDRVAWLRLRRRGRSNARACDDRAVKEKIREWLRAAIQSRDRFILVWVIVIARLTYSNKPALLTRNG